MCSTPKVTSSTPAATPDVDSAQTTPTSPALNEQGASRTSDKKDTTSKRKGTKGLRIDLQVGNAGAGGTGLNIPKA